MVTRLGQRLTFAAALALLLLAAYVGERAGAINCYQQCKNSTYNGHYLPDWCYQYDGNGVSCYACGTGSPGSGFCPDNPDARKYCIQQTGKTIDWRVCRTCGKICQAAVPNQAWQEVICFDTYDKVYSEPLYLCWSGGGS
jgi:hypothetical protein